MLICHSILLLYYGLMALWLYRHKCLVVSLNTRVEDHLSHVYTYLAAYRDFTGTLREAPSCRLLLWKVGLYMQCVAVLCEPVQMLNLDLEPTTGLEMFCTETSPDVQGEKWISLPMNIQLGLVKTHSFFIIQWLSNTNMPIRLRGRALIFQVGYILVCLLIRQTRYNMLISEL